MLLQEHSHLTSQSAPQQGVLGLLMGIYRGRRGRVGEGRKGISRCQCFKLDAAAVSTDDASAVSASTQLDDQLRTLWFLDIKARCGAACSEFPMGHEAAAEHLKSGYCCIWNMFHGNSSSIRWGEGLMCNKTWLKMGNGEEDEKAILLRLSRAMLTERPVCRERWWSRSRQMDGDRSFQAPPLHAGGPGCRDCQCMVNYLNGERGKGNGCICRTSF